MDRKCVGLGFLGDRSVLPMGPGPGEIANCEIANCGDFGVQSDVGKLAKKNYRRNQSSVDFRLRDPSRFEADYFPYRNLGM